MNLFLFIASLLFNFLVSSGNYSCIMKPYKNCVLKEDFGFSQFYSIVNSYVTLSREHSGHALSCTALSVSTVVT